MATNYVVNRNNLNSATAATGNHAEYNGEKSSPGRCQLEAQKFIDRTTIPGVSHCSHRHSYLWRLTWLVVTIAGLTMAVFQSMNVFKDFLGDSIVQVITFKMKNELIFPGVTVCSNLLVDLNGNESLLDPVILKLVRDADMVVEEAIRHSLLYTEMEAKIDSIRTQVMSEMAGNWSHDKRVRTFGNGRFFQDCKWKSKKCDFRKDFYSFHSLRYGKCMTFNAGFDGMKKAGSGQGFTGILSMNLESRARVINPDYAVLVIHPSSLPPVPGLENVIRIHPGERVRIFIEGKSVNYEKVVHIKPCIAENEVDKYTNDLYLSNSTPYKYSEKACVASCRFHKTIEKYRCVDPSLPLDPVLKAFVNGTRTICQYTDFLSEMKVQTAECHCLKNCKDPVVTPAATTSPLLKMSSKFLSSMENSSTDTSFNKISARHAVVQVVFANTEYMRVTEEPKYSTADFFGMFGGNLSLWVGVNFLCLVEFVEFLLILFYCKICYLCRNGGNVSESSQSIASSRPVPRIATIEMQ